MRLIPIILILALAGCANLVARLGPGTQGRPSDVPPTRVYTLPPEGPNVWREPFQKAFGIPADECAVCKTPFADGSTLNLAIDEHREALGWYCDVCFEAWLLAESYPEYTIGKQGERRRLSGK